MSKDQTAGALFIMRRILYKIVVSVFVICHLSFVISAQALAEPSILYRIRFAHFPEKMRAVFDFDGAFTYQINEMDKKIIIYFKNASASSDISNYVELNDLIVRHFEVEKEDDNLKITIPFAEPIGYNVFYLNDPPRLVVDFDREFLNIVSGGTIAEGIEFLKVRKGSSAGQVGASVLKIDLTKARVEPALARKNRRTVFDPMIDFFVPWTEKEPPPHFSIDTVSNIAKDKSALAGVNGTYYAYSGRPLGALIIDRELVSSPIYDRTAFFLDEKNTPYIDNISVSSHFRLPDGARYKIGGVNQGRMQNEIIMFTSAWGDSTDTNERGIEIVVTDSKVSEINVSNSKIPRNGYVLSAIGPTVENLAEKVRIGDVIDTRIKIIPHISAPNDIVHLISGGPRLLKSGRIYVSKHEEKFKMDIAQGRAARTAVGITNDDKLLLVTVDGPGRKKQRDEAPSVGMTLEELSSLLINLGAVEAMNLDGGSSSTMVIGDKVINNPTSGFERKVSNAIVVWPKVRVPQPRIR